MIIQVFPMRFCVPVLSLSAALLGLPISAQAIDNIPSGTQLWLQGITGVIPTAGFEIDGTLRFEAIDEPADIGIQILSGEVTNAPTGTIISASGPGGWRYIEGSVLNEGAIQISSPVFDLPDSGAVLENHGIIDISPFTGLRMYGAGCLFDMEEGEVHVSSPTGYIHMQGGEFRYNGGIVDGTIIAYSSKVTVADRFTNNVNVQFVGPHCIYDGSLSINKLLTIDYEPRFGPVDLTLTNVEQLTGQIIFETTAADSPAVLNTSTNGLLVANNGSITINDGLGSALIAGSLRVGGAVANLGMLRVSSPNAITNSGQWTLGPNGLLTADASFVLDTGALHLGGGTVNAKGGLMNLGGTVDGSGTILGDVTNSGLISVTNSNPVSVTGNLNQEEAGSVTVNIMPGKSNAPAINMLGNLTLAGKLAIQSPSPLFPTNGQSYLLITAGNISGGFSSAEFPNRPLGLQWHLQSDNHSVKLVALAGQPALTLRAYVATDSGNRTIEIAGALGANLLVQRSPDLNHWTNIASFGTFGGYLRLPLDETNATQSYYRADFLPAP